MPLYQTATCPTCREYNDNRSRRSPSQDPYGTSPWHAQCNSCRAAARRSRTSRVPRVPATRLGLQRRFGVEIECNVAGGRSGATATRIINALPQGWRLKSDGSLGSRGVEVVSPPLQGEDGMSQLRQVCELLRQNGAEVDRTCGLHVHHDVSDVGATGLVRFAKSWTRNSGLLNWLVSPSRRSNSYCRQLDDRELRTLQTWANRYPNAAGRSSQAYVNVSRYRAVNAVAYAKFGTVEVRSHQGTLSFRKMEAWVLLGQSMLDTLAAPGPAEVREHSTLRSLFNALSLDEDTAAYFLGRALQFNAPATEVA